MVAERLTAQAIATELDILDGEAKVVAGGVVVTIGFTNATVKTGTPREWEEAAAWLFALLAREPLRSSPTEAFKRALLGSLAMELRGFAQAAGEPVGLQADLRAASTQQQERRIRERLDQEAATYDRHVDDVLAAHTAQQIAAQHHEEMTTPEPVPDAAPAAEEPDVLAAWT